MDYWCRSTFEVIEDLFGGLLDIASETLNLISVSEVRIQVKKNLCGFVQSTIEITNLKRGNIYLHFGDFEFLNPTSPLKAPTFQDDLKNSLYCLRVREVMLDEDIDSSFFPSVQKILKSVFPTLPRSRNPFEILKIFPTIPPMPKKKTVAGSQVEDELNVRAIEQAPFLIFAKPKSDSCCKQAVGSTFNDSAFKFPVVILWKCASRSLLWSIWKERNSRIFEDRFNSFDSFWTVVQHTASWWSTKYTKHFCNYSLSMIFNNWKAIMS